MDLDSVAEELYRASPDEFVARRKELADVARAAKDRALVKEITQLRRPTRSAWLVNLLARGRPTPSWICWTSAHSWPTPSGAGPGPICAGSPRTAGALIDSLIRDAVALGAAEGHSATEATRQEVSQTLQAALADPAVADLVSAGRVIQPASYGGFGPTDLQVGLSIVQERASADAPTDVDVTSPPVAADQPDPVRLAAEEALRVAQERLTAAQKQVSVTEERAQQATRQADDLADRCEQLRAQLAQAETAEGAAQDAARKARKEHQLAQQELTTATQSVTDSAQALV